MKNVKHFFLFFPGIIVTGILYSVYALCDKKKRKRSTGFAYSYSASNCESVYINRIMGLYFMLALRQIGHNEIMFYVGLVMAAVETLLPFFYEKTFVISNKAVSLHQ